MTGLVPAMYLNPKGEEVPCPDPKAGLYIKSRKGDLVRVSVPKNCLAFQIGETACIHSGGLLQGKYSTKSNIFFSFKLKNG